jgi:antitoxin (DNA-binding transcriptional repressor) of toxin-antitoxin stability system
MKTVTIRELHSRTGQLVREAAQHGEIRVTDSGQVIAKIVPESEPAEVPYFARRKMSPAFRRLYLNGRLGAAGTDVTQLISNDREDRV